MLSGSHFGTPLLLCAAFAHAQSAAFRAEWANPADPVFTLVSHGGSTATAGVSDAAAADGKALELKVATGAATSPAGGSQVETKSPFLYGTATARIRTADCKAQPEAGIVTGFFTYFNDGSDRNGDGLPDNSELDFEWLCAEPEVIYLTLWTDYRDSDARSRRVGRVLNLAKGTIASTAFKTDWGAGTVLTGPENQPETLEAVPGYNSASAYHEYGISWDAGRILLWVIHPKDARRLVLWDYRGPAARIPARASRYMINAWHSSTWTPPGHPQAVKPPANPISVFVDWSAYDPAPVPVAVPAGARRGGARVEQTAAFRFSGVDFLGRRPENPPHH